MAGFPIISDVSEELRRQLFESLNSATELEFNVTNAVSSILLGPPDDIDAGNGALASLYLYHLLPSSHLRNQRLLPDRANPDHFRQPPFLVQLHYLLTPLGADEPTKHALLGRVIQHFHDSPSFDTLSGTPIGDGFGGAPRELRVSIDALGFEQLAHLWSAFSAPYRLSLALKVELVAVDSGVPAQRLPRATEVAVLAGLKG